MKLADKVTSGIVFLSSSKLTDRQGRMEVAWPVYGFVRKDREGGGVIPHHHSKLDVEEIKT
jgi:hypothetical protein